MDAYWQKSAPSSGWNLTEVWLTHSHWDHAKGVNALKQAWVVHFTSRSHAFERQRGWEEPVDEEWTHQANSQHRSCGLLEHSRPIVRLATPLATPPSLAKGSSFPVIACFLGAAAEPTCIGGDPKFSVLRCSYLRDQMHQLPRPIVLPGHQYELEMEQTPTTMRSVTVLRTNEALLAVDDDKAWSAFPFLGL